MRLPALFVLGLCLAGAAFELGLRAIGATTLWRILPQPEVALYGPDRDTGYRHRPGVRGVWLTENRAFIAINSLGFRDRERSLAKPPSTQRAVVIGDSVIEALQVDLTETAVFVAERELAKRGRRIEVVNLGLAGATPAVQVARLRAHGRLFQPDIVIVVTSIGDFLAAKLRDESEFPGYSRDPGGRMALSYRFRDGAGYRFRTSPIGRATYWALDRFEFARVLNARKNVGMLAEWPRPREAASTEPGSKTRCASPADLARQLALWRDGRGGETREILEAFLRDLGQAAREHVSPIVLALREIGEPCAATAAQRRELVDAATQLAARHGITVIDLDWRVSETFAFEPEAARVLHGFRGHIGGGHLNVRGNAVYGTVLADLVDKALARR